MNLKKKKDDDDDDANCVANQVIAPWVLAECSAKVAPTQAELCGDETQESGSFCPPWSQRGS
eukprot:CAMPEP_0206467822 /NCGR_PEP_ID=MMETSP0324_2-20121206/29254_1 /ASSEMBLY_ACC=CAM_ASM_000836 /TAXON_ID=2866 /ORGANISM="Crypthecodinium cohnii, Strain Seligo" /LENGTH=61 /DNA_ID=CAMNT_0053941145 /DNA_START=86 /DNA_END=272 /DNA_ORIENTATION=+